MNELGQELAKTLAMLNANGGEGWWVVIGIVFCILALIRT